MGSSVSKHRAINTPQEAKRRRLPLRGFAHIDAMRAGAVMLVVFSHAGLTAVPGGSGVTIFFVISGFIITHLLLRELEKTNSFDIRGFYLRRALKIFPPLLVIVILPSLVYGLFKSLNWVDVAGQLLFFFNWVYVDSDVSVLPGTIVVWSLSIEEQFYLAVAFLWLLLVRGRRPVAGLRVLAWAIIVYSVLARAVLFFSGATSDRIYFGTDTRSEAIAMGILVALWFRTRRLRAHEATGARAVAARKDDLLGKDVVLWVALVLYLVSLIIRDDLFRETLRYSMQAVAAALVIMWGLVGAGGPMGRALNRFMKLQIVQLLGLASYSIYLVHLIVIRALEPVTAGLPEPITIVLGVVLGTGAGVLVWWGVEEPVVKWRQRKKAKSAAATTALNPKG
ncbi:acyltransferase family protein [Kocuria carniphila]